MSNNTKLYTVFHLNLAFSSIDVEQHKEVVDQCYWPLLHLAQSGMPVGIELTAYTLEAIARVDPHWLAEFKRLIELEKCELIASGDSQIIGPLVPADVNHANLRLGQATYQQLLGVSPHIAYINEQAVSAGLLDVYIDEGFKAVVVEWDNPYAHNHDWSADLLKSPQTLTSASGRKIKVIWNHAIAFQKFQRYVHAEITLQDYLEYLQKSIQVGDVSFPIYGSDAEVFDFRPGRYQTEAGKVTGEWQRVEALFHALNHRVEYQWRLPSQVANLGQPTAPLNLTNGEYPVSVKKQAKYNICRWGLSGRNDLLLNTFCQRELKRLKSNPVSDEGQWRNLCRLWASDLRTHLTPKRYQGLTLPTLESAAPEFLPWQEQDGVTIHYDDARRRLHIRTADICLSLNTYRGLAIDSLAFSSHDFVPVAGTLPHGHFEHIGFGADFYSNHILLERFRHRDRIADLNRVDFQLGQLDGDLVIYCHQHLKVGGLIKWYRLKGESISCGFHFEDNSRQEASTRLGFITLLDCSSRAWYQTHLGGHQQERFQINHDIDQGAPVSSIVSSSSALGATQGCVSFGNGKRGLKFSWDPAQSAALPMFSSKQVDDLYLNRLWFSLTEADETLKEGGQLLDFTMTISPEIYSQ